MDQNKRIPSSAFIYIFARWRQLKLIILELDEIDDLVFVYTQISLNSISEYSFLSCVEFAHWRHDIRLCFLFAAVVCFTSVENGDQTGHLIFLSVGDYVIYKFSVDVNKDSSFIELTRSSNRSIFQRRQLPNYHFDDHTGRHNLQQLLDSYAR